MKKNKKGTDAATPMPRRERSLTNNHSYSNTYKTMCLLLILAFFVLVVDGTITNNDLLTTLGLGLGASGGLILARINTKEEE